MSGSPLSMETRSQAEIPWTSKLSSIVNNRCKEVKSFGKVIFEIVEQTMAAERPNRGVSEQRASCEEPLTQLKNRQLFANERMLPKNVRAGCRGILKIPRMTCE